MSPAPTYKEKKIRVSDEVNSEPAADRFRASTPIGQSICIYTFSEQFASFKTNLKELRTTSVKTINNKTNNFTEYLNV